jgi:GH25 family lysozyme M1 (1,4-beta-N-acetylmuramidase)
VRIAIVYALVVVGCAQQDAASPALSGLEQDSTVCGVGPTVKGIDVSYYQGTIDWTKVKADGVQFAVIRVSDGTTTIDPKFETYWAGSRANGIVHGAYQFFRPGQDVIAQADLLLSKVGDMAADDLPPVLDVEAADGLSSTQVAAKVQQWVDHVTPVIGRAPIIYTGFYFWRDSVGGPDLTTSPLWHAQYTSASCPNIAAPWTDWAIWQYSSSGSVNGIAGNVDMDRWNGDRASLDAFLGPPGACGDGACGPGETQTSCPEDCGPCGTIGAAGGVIDDGDACFEGGGPQTYMRQVNDAGEDGDLVWTHATEDTTEANFGQWNLYLAEAGRYRVEVYTDTAYAQSKQASYVVHTDTDHAQVLDQSAVDGWQTLGEYDFAAGGHQWIHLADNTGEPLASQIQVVFDAVRLTRLDQVGGDGSGSGSGGDDPGDGGGCAAGGQGSGLGAALLLACLALRRRRAT